MIRLLLLNYEYPPLGGGAANATYYLLKELSGRKDIEITLVTSSDDQYKEERISDNIYIYYLDIGKKGRNKHWQSWKDLITYSLKAYRICVKLMIKNKYNLVHAFFGIPCGYIAMRLNAPYIVSLRGSDVPYYNNRFFWLDKLFFKRLSGKIWKEARAVIANSSDLRGLALEAAPDVPISVIENGVDVRKFYPADKKDDGDFVILSTSRLIQRKGLEYLLEAFLSFKEEHPQSKLILAGDGKLKPYLRGIVKEKNGEDKVDFLGGVSHPETAELYRKADVFVLPSLNEGMSNSLLEAMASGLAIVSTDTGGAGHLLKNNGILVDKKSSRAIQWALNELITNPDKLSRMKEASRKSAEKRKWDRMAARYLKIYNKQAASPPPGV